ncbi:MAG: hypothetical protein ABI581_02935 [Sediminibacterium sp.]
MKRNFLLILSVFFIVSGCKTKKNAPDVSGITISLKTERFETDFFAIDTLGLNASLTTLTQKHPGFTQDFLFNILGTSKDSAGKDISRFISSYKGMYLAVQEKFRDISPEENEIKKSFRFIRHYFPAYKLPSKLVTFIGPINSYGNILTQDAVAVGLQLYMGSDYPLYLSEMGQQMYPFFVSRRFAPEYIPVNCIKNIIDDMYPNSSLGRPLVEQMVESGKRVYLLDLLMPDAADSIKTGYTQKQLDQCYASEMNIWSFFVQNDMLYKNDPNLTRDYMNDGPGTAALGDAFPGNIGQFVGMQIVRKWMERQRKLSPDQLMKTPARQIFDEARYKPK